MSRSVELGALGSASFPSASAAAGSMLIVAVIVDATVSGASAELKSRRTAAGEFRIAVRSEDIGLQVGVAVG